MGQEGRGTVATAAAGQAAPLPQLPARVPHVSAPDSYVPPPPALPGPPPVALMADGSLGERPQQQALAQQHKGGMKRDPSHQVSVRRRDAFPAAGHLGFSSMPLPAHAMAAAACRRTHTSLPVLAPPYPTILVCTHHHHAPCPSACLPSHTAVVLPQQPGALHGPPGQAPPTAPLPAARGCAGLLQQLLRLGADAGPPPPLTRRRCKACSFRPQLPAPRVAQASSLASWPAPTSHNPLPLALAAVHNWQAAGSGWTLLMFLSSCWGGGARARPGCAGRRHPTSSTPSSCSSAPSPASEREGGREPEAAHLMAGEGVGFGGPGLRRWAVAPRFFARPRTS